MSISVVHLRSLVVKTLSRMPAWYSEEVVELLILTACNESDCGRYLTQLGSGPALGIFGIEPDTLVDIYDNWLRFRPELADEVASTTGIEVPDLLAMEGNIVYGILIARIQYLRARPPLPSVTDHQAMAHYYVKYFNRGGKAVVEVAREKYRLYAKPNQLR